MVKTTDQSIQLLPYAILLALLLPNIVHHGMFLDGLTYAGISRNLAMGTGSFWQPHYTQTIYPAFYEHPPLAFGLQAILYKLLGDYFYVDKLYSLFTALATFAGIAACWNLISISGEKNFAWPALLCLLCMPLAIWSYSNNLLENTMTVFCLFAVFYIAKGCKQNRFLPLLWGSLLVVLAFYTKGFPALFPLVVPFLYWTAFRNCRIIDLLKMQAALIAMTVLLFLTSIYFIPEAEYFLKTYINLQVLPSVSGEREVTATYRLHFVWIIFQTILIPVLLIVVMLFFNRWKPFLLKIHIKQESVFFLLLALSASLPLILSPKQRDFYLVTSLPYFALSFGFILLPLFQLLISRVQSKWKFAFRYLNVLLIAIAIIFSMVKFGSNSRDDLLLQDVFAMQEIIPAESLISTQNTLFTNWLVVAYLQRYGQISLEHSGHQPFLLLERGESPHHEIVHRYELSVVLLNRFDLYRRIDQ